MKSLLQFTTVCFTLSFCLAVIGQEADEANQNWTSWRGPTGNGIVDSTQSAPTEWNEDTNVIWKVPVPGRGHASPTIVGDKILLATADDAKQTQSVVAFDRASGEKLWETEVHQGKFPAKIYPKNTHASSTIATDGVHAFAVFNNADAVWLSALTLDGEIAWQKEMGQYSPKYDFGFGASPILQDGKLFVTSESQAENFIIALDPASGEQIYRIERAIGSSYSTPVMATVAGKRQLLLSGGRTVKGYDPENGEELWSAATIWDVSCGTLVWHDDIVFASGGYPKPQTIAVRGDGSGKVLWTHPVKCYEQSMIVVDGFVYGQSDRGVIYCWRAADGKEMWKGRTEGPVSASPVFVDGHIYFTSEQGNTFVIKANPKEYQLVSKNKLGNSTFASFTVLDNRIFTRVGVQNGDNRNEFLYCLGEVE